MPSPVEVQAVFECIIDVLFNSNDGHCDKKPFATPFYRLVN